MVDLEPLTLDIVVSGLKAQIERDSRDNQFYPEKGSVLSISADFNEEAFGSDFTFQKYGISHQSYFQFRRHHILAYTITACDIEGKAPFFNQCMLGSSADLRGYATGQHQDRRMIAGQAEYRLGLPWRFGAVGFMGAGAVADQWSNFKSEEILPGGGIGLRFLLAKSNHVNLRFDYAWGKEGSAWYVGLGEAF
ncbi:MAG: BamA/TamA family outer membrane protein [Acidobacteriota bacterium]